MNQKIVDYLQQNKDNYSKESLLAQLKSAGYKDGEISEAINVVFAEREIPLPQNKISQQVSDSSDNEGDMYAGFGIRFGAYLIDMIIAFLLVMVMGGVLSGAMNISLLEMMTDNRLLYTGINFVIVVIYYILMTHMYQATVGKLMLGIKVCDETDLQKSTLKAIFYREILSKLIMVFTWGLLHVVIAFTPKSQGVHDKVAHTVVVYKDKS